MYLYHRLTGDLYIRADANGGGGAAWEIKEDRGEWRRGCAREWGHEASLEMDTRGLTLNQTRTISGRPDSCGPTGR
jgi:hypothetical protein